MVYSYSLTAPKIARKEAARMARKAYEKRKTRQVAATREQVAADAEVDSLSDKPFRQHAATFSTAAAAAVAAAAFEATEKEKKTSNLETLFVKTRGQRNGNAGHYYKCSVLGCDK
jgi:hypothetical protein